MKRMLFFLLGIFLYIFSYADFGIYASAVYLNKNGTGSFYNTLHSPDASQNIGSLEFSGNLGTFEKNSGTLKLNGGEVKTYMNGGNVCSGTIYYRAYSEGSTPGVFQPINLPFYSNCNTSTPCNGYAGAFPVSNSGGCCNAGDQKWQETVTPQIDLTTFPSGNYILEVYFTITGDGSSSAGCGSTLYDSFYGNNYKANFTISNALPVVFGNIEASIKNKVLFVNWTTVKETNVAYYNILATSDGNSYSEIGKINSKALQGNSDSKLFYTFSKNLDSNSSYLLGYTILGFACISVVFRRKNKMVTTIALLIIGLFIISCSRDNQAITGNSRNTYVKIVQMDKSNNKLESKVVRAIEE